MKNQTYRMTMLFDFYGELLTDRQKEFFDLYYNEDLSLSEIAENEGISRQGVRDVIVRAEAAMQEIEDKTGLIRRFEQFRGHLDAICDAAEEIRTLNYRQYEDSRLTELTDKITAEVEKSTHAVAVEDIQDMVETGIMEMRGYEVAQKYIRYRYKRSLARKANTTDESILALIDQTNEEMKQENSNKNPVINSTQRDYMAGEVSKDLSRRILLPEDVVKAHDEGMIHYHDMDYNVQRMFNCDLINLDDMLQNGTVISGTKIDKPHSFYTACNITTQIIAQVASNQFGPKIPSAE